MIEELLNNRVISEETYKTLLKIYRNESDIREVFYDVLGEYIFDRVKEFHESIDWLTHCGKVKAT